MGQGKIISPIESAHTPHVHFLKRGLFRYVSVCFIIFTNMFLLYLSVTVGSTNIGTLGK